MPTSVKFNLYLFEQGKRKAFQIDGAYARDLKDMYPNEDDAQIMSKLKAFFTNMTGFDDLIVHDYKYGILVVREVTLQDMFGSSGKQFAQKSETEQTEHIGKLLEIPCTLHNWDLKNNHQIAIEVNNEDFIVYMCNCERRGARIRRRSHRLTRGGERWRQGSCPEAPMALALRRRARGERSARPLRRRRGRARLRRERTKKTEFQGEPKVFFSAVEISERRRRGGSRGGFGRRLEGPCTATHPPPAPVVSSPTTARPFAEVASPAASYPDMFAAVFAAGGLWRSWKVLSRFETFLSVRRRARTRAAARSMGSAAHTSAALVCGSALPPVTLTAPQERVHRVASQPQERLAGPCEGLAQN